MSEQDVSTGICVIRKFPDSIFFKAHCDCGSDNHIQTLCMEYDEEVDMIDLHIYSNSYDSKWYNESTRGVFYKISRRVKHAFNILFRGYFETEIDYVFHGEDHIRDYLNALTKALEYVKNKNRDKMSTTVNSKE